MMAGGTGLTPMLQVLQASLRDNSSDTTTFALLVANKTEDDILCRSELLSIAEKSEGRIKVHFTLDFPPAGWKGETGFITPKMIQKCLPEKNRDPLVLLCGPPPMVEFACKKNLREMGFDMERVVNF